MHMFASDPAEAARSLIMANCAPVTPVYEDMLARDHTLLPSITHYVAGFPCQPFSMLRRHRTRLMREPQALPFFAVVDTIKAKLPQVAVLENVRGIKVVMHTIMRSLRSNQQYHIFTLNMNPVHLGEPIQRPRIYFLLVRKDCAITSARRPLEQLLQHMWDACRSPLVVPLQNRCLPAHHPEVLRVQAIRRAKFEQARRAGTLNQVIGPTVAGKPPRWIADHLAFKRGSSALAAKSAASSAVITADELLLRLPRERDMLDTVCTLNCGLHWSADFSQGIARCGLRKDGVQPPTAKHRWSRSLG
jgi:site-specific DNA-cytosine methylase